MCDIKRAKFIVLCAICFLFRLNLSHAQNPLGGSGVQSTLDNVQNQVNRAAPINSNNAPSGNSSGVVYQVSPGSPPTALPTTSAAGGPPITVTPATTPTANGSNSNAVPAGPGVGGNSPATNANGTNNPGAAGAAVDPASLSKIQDLGPRYAEYQSICRYREYDKVKYQAADVQTERLNEIKEQLKNSADGSAQDTLVVLKELIDFGDIAGFKSAARTLKLTKMSSKENEMLNSLMSLAGGSYRDARVAMLKALAGDEKNEFILKTLAEIYLGEQNFYEAATIYEDLNKMRKNSYLVELCEVMVLNSLNAEGEEVCTLAQKKFPDSPFPYIYAGITHRERQANKRATALFRKSINVKPTEMGNICLAEMSLIEDKPSEAAEFFKQSLEQSPYSVRAVLGLAWSELKAKNYPGALTAFKQACRINRRFETEIRKAYKALSEDKVPNSRQFLQLAETCGR